MTEVPTYEVVEAHYTLFGRIPTKEPNTVHWAQNLENENAFKSGRKARVCIGFSSSKPDGINQRVILQWKE